MDQDNSYIISKFTNYDDGHLDEGNLNSLFPEKAFMEAFTSLALERGKPKYTAIYNSAGNRVKSTTTSYLPLRNNRTFVRAADAQMYQVCNYGTLGTALVGPYVYEGGAYKIYTYPYVPVSITDSVFDNSSSPIVSVINLYYDNPLNKLTTRIEQIRTDGQKLTSLTLYPQDYTSSTGFINNMLSKDITAMPIEKVKYLTDPVSGTVKILSGELTSYNASNPLFGETDYYMENQIPISLTNFKFSGSAIGVLPFNTSKLAFIKDPLYKSKVSYEYDISFNLKQINNTDGNATALFWGYNNSLLIAQVVNAKKSEAYYIGFEEETTGISSDSKIGLKSKLLNGAAFTLPTLTSLPTGRKYILSFWYKNTGDIWRYFTSSYLTLPPTISGYTLIDELRIFPENAQMKTMGYISPLGQLIFTNDATGRSQSFEYDGMQRLKLVRDEKSNILKDYTYSFAPSQTTVDQFYFNSTKTGSYQKSNCTGGKTGTAVIYSVSAGSYVSTLSQTDADNQAQNEVTLKGTSFANLNGKCLFYNSLQSGTFYRSTCVKPAMPSPYTVNVTAGKYSSEISQTDADAKAADEITAAGLLVNSKGSCYIPAATVIVQNLLSGTPNKQVNITLRNLSTNIQYTSDFVTQNQSKNFTIPPGIYSIGYSATIGYTSLQLYKNSVLIDCKGNPGGSQGNFGNITIVHNDSVTFILSFSTCPPLPQPD